MTTNNKIKQCRQKSGCKREDAAKIIGVTVRQYDRIEAKTPKSVIQFYQLAKFYGVTVDYLLQQDINNKK